SVENRSGRIRFRALAEAEGPGRLEFAARGPALVRRPDVVSAEFLVSKEGEQARVLVFRRSELSLSRLAKRGEVGRARRRIHAIQFRSYRSDQRWGQQRRR